MITSYDVYCSYIEAKSEFSGKILNTLPEDKFLNRISEENQYVIEKLSGWFNTKFNKIDLYRYMLCGFKLWKTFNYSKFLDERIIEEYINQDKRNKRNFKSNPDTIRSSMRTIDDNLKNYCNKTIGISNEKVIINDFILGKIDPVIIVYCMVKNYVKFSDLEKSKISIIFNNYDELINKLSKLRKIVIEEEKLL